MMGGVIGSVRNDVPPTLSREAEICGVERLHARRRPKSAYTALWVLKSTKRVLGDHILVSPSLSLV
jgi:hypothetical protein